MPYETIIIDKNDGSVWRKSETTVSHTDDELLNES